MRDNRLIKIKMSVLFGVVDGTNRGARPKRKRVWETQ